MDSETFEQYKRKRYETELNWYDDKSIANRMWDRVTAGLIIVFAAAAPIIILFPSSPELWTRIIGAAITALIAVISGLRSIFKFHELYVNYRTVAETMKKEIHYYEANLEPYSSAADREGFFVQRIESLVSRENTLWQEIAQRKCLEVEKGKNVGKRD